MKTVLITGGAGFIGSNFVRHLHSRYPDYRLIVLDALTYAGTVENLPPEFRDMHNSQFAFWYGNVRNAELVDTLVGQSDVVVHFAAETHVTRSIYDNLLFFETDVLGTQVVVNAVLKHLGRIERFIHVSSSEVYGTARTPLMSEDHPLMPMSPYAAAKAGADRLVYSYWETYGVPAIIVRPFNNYGPFQHLEKVIPRFITSCILDQPLRVHGDGSAARDWLYVEDTCGGLDCVLHADLDLVRGEVINLGCGTSTDIETIARLIVEKMRKPQSLITHIGDRPGQVLRHTASTEKARQLLGWGPKVGFGDGLDKTIEWYRASRPWWEKQLWMRSIPIVTKQGTRELH
ncbi:MAG TPA: GDP-mannose 4,6-dehydratase [Candidatus Methylomirabilis sp.]|nr:GDP-mannose 4,6-dehydratase [Candidatus Methylomirabilis sp.]